MATPERISSPTVARLNANAVLTALACAGAFAAACAEAEEPPNVQVIRVSGSPYERGLQQGRMLKSRIRSFYTQMLEASLLPYLNRLRPDLARVLLEYRDQAYLDGRFSRRLLGDSALSLEAWIPEAYKQELRGIADGSELSYDEVLVLNTFVDSILGMRSVAFFVDQEQSPRIRSIALVETATESAAFRADPYEPLPHATFVEAPAGARIRVVLSDSDGVDRETVRLTLGERLYTRADPELTFRDLPGTEAERPQPRLEVTLTPSEPLPAASVVSLIVQAGDKSLVTDPPPSHARFMRDERIVFTTAGYGRAKHEVPNRGVAGRSIPPAIGFAVRGEKSAEGAIRLAHHFALLDNGTSHRHTAVIVHQPDDGPPFAVLSWCGVLSGFAGVNSRGLAFAANFSDTLNNTVAQKVKEGLIAAKLEADGLPMGVIGREILRGFGTSGEAASWLAEQKTAFGWNVIFADAERNLELVEIHSDVLGEGGVHRYDPDPGQMRNLDPFGRPWASESRDDLRMGVHYRALADDISFEILGFQIRPQRYWSSYYLRSVRAFSVLGERIAAAPAGGIDTDSAIEILRDPELVDPRDSMAAVVIEPETRSFRYALGDVPATDAPFMAFTLEAGE